MNAIAVIAEDVARNLSTAEVDHRGAYINTPMRYPGGTAVVVHIQSLGNRFFVTDMGFGMSEAEQIGAERQYMRAASEIARRQDVGFDQHSFFLAECSREQLVGAVGLIANCSKEAVDLAALRLAERRHVEAETAFFDRLEGLFGVQKVTRHAEIQGAHKADWPVGALVVNDNRRTIFDYVKPSAQSAYPIIAKFFDIGQLAAPPSRVAIVRRVSDLKGFAGMISDAGGAVIQADASDRTIMRAA